MAQEFEITGMHCGGCVNRVAKALRALDAGVAVTLEPPRATFPAEAQVSLDSVNATLAKIGDYRASEAA
jgi:copper chaperone CopZ